MPRLRSPLLFGVCGVHVAQAFGLLAMGEDRAGDSGGSECQ